MCMDVYVCTYADTGTKPTPTTWSAYGTPSLSCPRTSFFFRSCVSVLLCVFLSLSLYLCVCVCVCVYVCLHACGSCKGPKYTLKEYDPMRHDVTRPPPAPLLQETLDYLEESLAAAKVPAVPQDAKCKRLFRVLHCSIMTDYLRLYICVYVCVCVCVCVCMCLCICLSLCVYIYVLYVCMHACIHVCMCMDRYMHVHV